MYRSLRKNVVISFVCFSLAGIGMPLSANAGIVGTGDYLAIQDRDIRIERINRVLTQDKVRQQLTSLGVNPEHAKLRVAALTDGELAALDERMQELPAGGSALEVVLVVFLVLLILDLTGLTDIFPGIGPGKVK
jgi:hypothetical protein